MSNKLNQFQSPTKKCKKCMYLVENGLGMIYCNAPIAIDCDKDDNKSAPNRKDFNKVWDEYYESISFFG